MIPLEVLEADSTGGGSVEEQVSNDSHHEETSPQLSQIIDKLNEGHVYKENLEHCMFLLFFWDEEVIPF